MIQNHMTKHELLDQSVARANLFLSDVLGNTRRNHVKHVNGMHKFFLIMQHWGSVILFSSALARSTFRPWMYRLWLCVLILNAITWEVNQLIWKETKLRTAQVTLCYAKDHGMIQGIESSVCRRFPNCTVIMGKLAIACQHAKNA